LLAIIKGYSKGFIIALFSVVAFVVGLAAAIKLSAFVAGQLLEHFPHAQKWLPLLSFLLVFTAVVLLVNLGAKLVQKSVEFVLLGWLNRLAGMVLFGLLYSFLTSIFLFYAVQLHLLSPATVSTSKIYPYLQPLAPTIINAIGVIIPLFKNGFEQLEKFFETLPTTTSAG
jgi:membrane protein required for colicin V production